MSLLINRWPARSSRALRTLSRLGMPLSAALSHSSCTLSEPIAGEQGDVSCTLSGVCSEGGGLSAGSASGVEGKWLVGSVGKAQLVCR
jgi:hypothetical protein